MVRGWDGGCCTVSHLGASLPEGQVGASTEDLRAFTWQNISIDTWLHSKLPTEAVLVRRQEERGLPWAGASGGRVLGGTAIKPISRVYREPRRVRGWGVGVVWVEEKPEVSGKRQDDSDRKPRALAVANRGGVQKLLGPNLVGLKAEAGVPLRDWISRQSQRTWTGWGFRSSSWRPPRSYLILDLHSRGGLG